MLRSIDTLNRNINIIEKRQEKTSSNIANANTSGYKFQDIIQITAEERALINFSGGEAKDELQEIGSLNLRNNIDSVYRNMNQGSLKETGRNLDFALGERGFFTILLEDGRLGFTRDGNFKKDSDDLLVTMDGRPVLGLDENGNNIQINVLEDGLSSDLLVADFDDYENLNYVGDNLFTSENYTAIDEPVNQGFLEMSNVDVGDEMINMIQTLRELQANQRIMQTVDETLSKSVNEIGKV